MQKLYKSIPLAVALPGGPIGLAHTWKALALPAFCCSKNGLVFTALDLSPRFVRQLQAQADVFLKRWAGLPPPASTIILSQGDLSEQDLK